MNPSSHPTTISYAKLKSKTLAYTNLVSPTLQTLDKFRYEELPAILALRKKNGNAFLEKTELSRLIEWKLKHGTFRPNLLKLVSSNTDNDVHSTTESAFELFDANPNDYNKALSILTKLKGVGPATASLGLACYDPENAPFFSDELYRYLHYEDAKSKGWDRKIGYTAKEYKSLFEKCKEFRDRVAKEKEGGRITAVEVERAAYVIFREGKEGKGDEGQGKEEGGKRKRDDGLGGKNGGRDSALALPKAKRSRSSKK